MQSQHLKFIFHSLFLITIQLLTCSCVVHSSLSDHDDTETKNNNDVNSGGSTITQQSSSSSKQTQGIHQNNDWQENERANRDLLQKQSSTNRKAYITLVTSDREVDKSLVMFASLVAMTKTRDSMVPKDGEESAHSSYDEETYDYGQCSLDGKFNVQCDYHDHDHDYICLIIPKRNNKNFEHDPLFKKL